MKKITILFVLSQLCILILSYLSAERITLLSYINSSFYIGGLLMLIGGVIFIFRTGSFDFFMSSMRKVMSSKYTSKEVETMRNPSEVFSMSPKIFFLTGVPIFITMSIALILYYS